MIEEECSLILNNNSKVMKIGTRKSYDKPAVFVEGGTFRVHRVKMKLFRRVG